MTVSEWAAKNRYMSSAETSRPGPWRNEIVPYLIDIMDAMNRDDVEKIVFLKPTQVGGTEAGINIVGYIVAHKPTRIIYVLPDDDTLKEFSADRLQKVLSTNECFKGKYEANDSKAAMLRFAGGFCKFGSARSPMDLASWSAPVVVMDEIDKYVKQAGKEASPLKLAEERTKNWPGQRKLFFWSTPTLKTGQIWQLYEAADVRYEYQVPCPFCGHMQAMKWDNLRFDSTQTPSYVETHTHLECTECHEHITDKYKPDMLVNGKWVPLNEVEGKIRSVAYGLNSLYSPWVTFGQMAAEFLRSKDDQLMLKNFVNSWLGEPWESKSAIMDVDAVLEHKTECPMFTVPEWAQLLTGGVDVQKGHMYWEIHAWGPGLTSQVIAYGRALTWQDIEQIMDQLWIGEDGVKQYQVCIYGIDTGYRTEEVYDYCWQHQGRAFPVKGSSTPMPQYIKLNNIEPKTAGKLALMLVIVNTDMYKNEIAVRLENPLGRGSWMLNADCDTEFAEHITSEHRIVDDKGRERWEKKTSAKQNHWWDCCVYAHAVADLVNVRALQDIIVVDETVAVEDSETALPRANFTL